MEIPPNGNKNVFRIVALGLCEAPKAGGAKLMPKKQSTFTQIMDEGLGWLKRRWRHLLELIL